MSTLAERYDLGAEIGRGGMGVVHRAVERATGRTVAIKRLSPVNARDAALRTRFTRETRAMARVRHPNVVGIRDTGEDADGPWLVMDHCGGSLADRLRAGPLPPAEARGVARDVLAALSAIHAAGIIHRDLKPQNILLGDGRWRVSDFGIARDMTGVTAMTQAGMIIGTPDYLAPEHAGDGVVGLEADLYALGAVLQHALTGAPPYRADSALRLAVLHATAPPPVLPDTVRAADPALAGLVEGFMRKDPAARPTVAEALRRLAGHDETPTVAVAPAAAVTRRRRRRPGARRAHAAVLGAAALALGVAWIAGGGSPDAGPSTTPTTAPVAAPPVTVRTVTVSTAVAPAAPPPSPASPPRRDDRPRDADDNRADDAADGPRGERPGNPGRGRANGRDNPPDRGQGRGRP